MNENYMSSSENNSTHINKGGGTKQEVLIKSTKDEAENKKEQTERSEQNDNKLME